MPAATGNAAGARAAPAADAALDEVAGARVRCERMKMLGRK
jgi:hypothetical protein